VISGVKTTSRCGKGSQKNECRLNEIIDGMAVKLKPLQTRA